MLRPGMFLQDRYEILDRIGSGGMSDVYKARCHKLDRLVAIKVLKEEFSCDANFVSKFKMEAQAAARLSHPNIVNIYDVIDEGNLHYIVMELIEGVTLKNYIAKKGMLGIKESIGIAIQVAQGIAAAHEQHIIHRDIKPQNMIISKDGKVKVADFGIARAASSQTMNSTAVGSVHYISPEQARGGYSDERSDIYSLGITMYEMVTGRVPFEGDNTVAIALAHLEDPIAPPSMYNPNIPISLEKIILKCTEKSPERRYNNIAEIVGDLRRALVNPDEDFVRAAPEMDSNAQTVTISSAELARIKEGKRSSQPSRGGYSPQLRAEMPHRNEVKHRADTTSGKGNRGGRPDDDEDEELSRKMEKLLTGVGVFVAVIIVVVLVFIFAKLGGLFRSGSSDPGQSSEITGQSLSDKEVLMPSLLGLTSDEAEAKLRENTLTMVVDNYEYSDQYEKGQVMSQEINEGTIVEKHSKVKVVISNGSNKIDLTLLSLNGMDAAAAEQLLKDKKLNVTTQEENSETVDKGKVISFAPEKVDENGNVTLVVSKGPVVTMAEVPKLVGQTDEIAIGLLEQAGLVPGEVKTESSPTVTKGVVISQSVAENTHIEKGSAISYVVSSGPEEESSTEETITDPNGDVTTGGHGQYYGSISKVFNLKDVFGPGAETFTISVEIIAVQKVNGEEKQTTLMEPKTMTGDTALQLRYANIPGVFGVSTGEVQVWDLTNNRMLKSYTIQYSAK
jgi:eukaryotic-like serine/threonine-protein kinase